MAAQHQKALRDKRIGFFGKGGSGKSTVAVLLAKALRHAGYDVCLLDADSTNIGIAGALGMAGEPVPLLDYYGGMVFSGGSVTCPVDDPTPLAGGHIPIEELPDAYHRRTADGIDLFVAGKMGDKGPGAGCDGPIAKIARDFRPGYDDASPVFLVDFKAGFEDSARGNIISLDWIVVVVDPTSAAIQMAVHMQEMVARLRAGAPPATAHLDHPDLVALVNRLYRNAAVKGVHFVLNRVRDDETEQFMREKLARHGIRPVGTIPDFPALSRAWLTGAPLDDEAARAEIDHVMRALEAAEEAASAATVGQPAAVA